MSQPLHDIGPVHPCGRDLDDHLARTAGWPRPFSRNEHLGAARRADLDRDHLIIVVEQGSGSRSGALEGGVRRRRLRDELEERDDEGQGNRQRAHERLSHAP